MKDLDYNQRLRSFARHILPLVQDCVKNHSEEYHEFLLERGVKRKAQKEKKNVVQSSAENDLKSGDDGEA